MWRKRSACAPHLLSKDSRLCPEKQDHALHGGPGCSDCIVPAAPHHQQQLTGRHGAESTRALPGLGWQCHARGPKDKPVYNCTAIVPGWSLPKTHCCLLTQGLLKAPARCESLLAAAHKNNSRQYGCYEAAGSTGLQLPRPLCSGMATADFQ